MFEKYTDKARKVIFFARYEAGQMGSSDIKPEHILLGLFRVDAPLLNSFSIPSNLVHGLRSKINYQSSGTEKILGHEDMSLSDSAMAVLSHAADEATLLDSNNIGTEHMLLGLLHEKATFAFEFLQGYGLSLSGIRENLRGHDFRDLNDEKMAERVTNIVIELKALATAIMKKCHDLESMYLGSKKECKEENSENE